MSFDPFVLRLGIFAGTNIEIELSVGLLSADDAHVAMLKASVSLDQDTEFRCLSAIEIIDGPHPLHRQVPGIHIERACRQR